MHAHKKDDLYYNTDLFNISISGWMALRKSI